MRKITHWSKGAWDLYLTLDTEHYGVYAGIEVYLRPVIVALHLHLGPIEVTLEWEQAG